MRAQNPKQRAASTKRTAKSLQDPQPRSRVSVGDCVPSSSKLLIIDPCRNAGAEVFEEGKSIRPIAADEGPGPISQPSGRVRVLLDRQGAEISPFIIGVLERKENGGGGDVEDWPSDGPEFEFRDSVDREIVGHGLEVGDRNGVAEDILRPGHQRGGSHGHLARNQAKIATLTWAKHQTMRTES